LCLTVLYIFLYYIVAYIQRNRDVSLEKNALFYFNYMRPALIKRCAGLDSNTAIQHANFCVSLTTEAESCMERRCVSTKREISHARHLGNCTTSQSFKLTSAVHTLITSLLNTPSSVPLHLLIWPEFNNPRL
jgi:hypothetical protein